MACKIEQRVGIAAPVDDIYELVADIGRWPEWSPIHLAATGELHFGAPVHLEERFEGLGTWEIHGVVADWSPLSHIHIDVPKPFYAGKLTRYFEFESLSETGSIFTVGALFNGLLSEREGWRYAKFLRTGFAAFGEAVKAKAEAEFAAHPDHRARMPLPEPKKPQLGPTPKKWQKTKMFVLPYQIK
jgi:hypothetical protein